MYRARLSLVALLALVVVVTALAGCGRKGLVNVNGEKVMKEDFYARLERVPVQQVVNGRPVAIPAGRYVIEQIVREQIIQQLAKNEGVAPTEEQVNKKVQFIKKNAGADFRGFLAQRGMTEEEWKHSVEIEQALNNVVSKGVKIPDSDVKAAYDQQLKAKPSPFIRPEQVRISIIVTGKKDSIDKAYKLLKEGQDFGAVAMRLSEDPSKQAKGEIPTWISRGMQGIPESAVNTAFALQPGKYSQPLNAGNSWAIIKLNQKRPQKVQSYDEVKELIREQLSIQKGSQNPEIGKKIQDFTKNADITINAERYKNVADEIKKQAADAAKLLSSAKPNTTNAAQPKPAQ